MDSGSLAARTLKRHLPGHCLAAQVRVLGAPVLTGLRLKDLESRDAWVRVSYALRGKAEDRLISLDERPHLVSAMRGLIPDISADLDPEGLIVRIVEAINRRLEFPPAGPGSVVTEPAEFYLQPRPAVLFLTYAGHNAFKDELLRRIDQEEHGRQQRIWQALRDEWEEARKQIEELAQRQKMRLLYGYQLDHHDPEFQRLDQDLDRQQRSLGERWENFLADPGRIAQVVKKCTIDLGYGKETVARELLQNIDDAYHDSQVPDDRTPWIEFRQHKRALIVSHMGRPFSHDDLVRICGLGGSGKSDEFQIGRFGLGFKSVLDITTEPIVLSHPFAFKVRHVVVPEWIEPEEVERRLGHQWRKDRGVTRFVLDAPPGEKSVEELVDRLAKSDARTGELSTRVLLFLNHLREVSLETAKIKRVVERLDQAPPHGLSDLGRPPSFEELRVRLSRQEVSETERATVVEEFLVIEGRARVPVPTGARSQVRPLRFGIALPWDAANDRPGKPLGGDARLHLFLPTRTRTGLPFLVNGEFLTNLGRTDIDGDHETNKCLADAIAALTRVAFKALFTRCRDDIDGLRAVTRLAPWPGFETQEAPWLRPVRGVFAELIKADEPVILTSDGRLARRSDCCLGQRLAQAARGPLLAAEPSCPLPSLVDPEIEAEVERAAGGAIRKLTGPELVKGLFPVGLSRAKVIRRVRALLRVLHEQQGGDLTERTESYHALSQLSSVPCMPDEHGGVACPEALEHPDRADSGMSPARVADLRSVVEDDASFHRWIVENLHWAPILPSSPPPPLPPGKNHIVVTTEQCDRLWAHNLKRIAGWWTDLGPRGRQEVASPYSLSGDKLWPILGLGDVPAGQRAGRLQDALREDGPDHERTWFRLLCLANIAQSGRRFEEAVKFLVKFDREFDGFERLWGPPADAVGELIRRSIAAYIADRTATEQATYWRRLYDFAKIRTLLRERQFLPGFWDTADHHPAFLAEYLHRGLTPGVRFEHRGLGESLSSQAFFLCRECFRLGIIRGDGARENCYAPNRHLARFLRRAYGPDPSEWPDFEQHQALSHRLHAEVTRHTGTRDFEDAFDLPLFHLALHDDPTRLVPGLLLGDDVDGVRRFLDHEG